ncbi:hypothetical protein X740_17465 [Mesorhizobium sp. LNHC221B00]|nr:hypothetical protein X740_17465 [Mesorhizobium sp. LNHC221B00]
MVDELTREQSLTIIAPFTPDFSCVHHRLRLLARADKAIAARPGKLYPRFRRVPFMLDGARLRQGDGSSLIASAHVAFDG